MSSIRFQSYDMFIGERKVGFADGLEMVDYISADSPDSIMPDKAPTLEVKLFKTDYRNLLYLLGMDHLLKMPRFKAPNDWSTRCRSIRRKLSKAWRR